MPRWLAPQRHWATAGVLMVACGLPDSVAPMSEIAESYVKLALAVGRHDPRYIDAYYGPESWRREIDSAPPPPLAALRLRARQLINRLDATTPGGHELLQLRQRYLEGQLRSVVARLDMLDGAVFDFDEESRALYDAVAPEQSASHFEAIVQKLEVALPGRAPLAERYAAFQAQFAIPESSLGSVFAAAIDACRARTRRHLTLPPGDRFVVEYVTGKSWSGYNWYQGGYQSVIQVNTDLPIYVDRAVDLACHEGYPGHHTYNMLLEHALVRGKGWVEYTVYPLFSPQSLIAEGSANYGIDMAFPGEQRVEFERDTLYPLAGLDPARAADYDRVRQLVQQLSYAGNEAARQYLNGRLSGEDTARWLSRYALFSPERAAQRVRFIEEYRTYVINYNLGRDLVRRYVEHVAGAAASDARRWEVFGGLLASPRLPSGLTP